MNPQPGQAPGEGGCTWCGRPLPFRERPRGSPRRFCSTGCRHAYRAAALAWAMAVIETGLITVSDLKAPQESARAFWQAFQGSRAVAIAAKGDSHAAPSP